MGRPQRALWECTICLNATWTHVLPIHQSASDVCELSTRLQKPCKTCQVGDINSDRAFVASNSMASYGIASYSMASHSIASYFSISTLRALHDYRPFAMHDISLLRYNMHCKGAVVMGPMCCTSGVPVLSSCSWRCSPRSFAASFASSSEANSPKGPAGYNIVLQLGAQLMEGATHL